ncbi:MAG: VOC family protein [Beijerinckiaceae bacterium]|nr:VOC family protein [Beijerinckiaceae bacterium]
MIRLDHLVIPAPSLEDGVAYVKEALGVDVPAGGKHPTMGTHNHVLRLGPDVYLEVIAVDPDAPRRDGARWFGLHDQETTRRLWDEGRRLAYWVASTSPMEQVLKGREALFGVPSEHYRGESHWRFGLRPDGLPAMGGALPYLIERPEGTVRTAAMPDLGCRLTRLVVEHPEAERARATLAALTLLGPVELREGKAARIWAEVATVTGVRTL